MDLDTKGFHYNRINNPTVDLLGQRLSPLDSIRALIHRAHQGCFCETVGYPAGTVIDPAAVAPWPTTAV